MDTSYNRITVRVAPCLSRFRPARVGLQSRNISMDLEKRLLWGMKVVDEDGDANPNAKVDFDRLNVLQKVRTQCGAATETAGEWSTQRAKLGRE